MCRGLPELQRPPDSTGEDGDFWRIAGWHAYRSLGVLGHCVAWDGPSGNCWHSTSTSAWKEFWAVICTKHVRALCLALRMKRLNATILPALMYRMPCWVWSAALAQSLDRFQRRFIALLVGARPYSLEEPAASVRRHGRHAASIEAHNGAWRLVAASRSPGRALGAPLCCRPSAEERSFGAPRRASMGRSLGDGKRAFRQRAKRTPQRRKPRVRIAALRARGRAHEHRRETYSVQHTDRVARSNASEEEGEEEEDAATCTRSSYSRFGSTAGQSLEP